MNRKSGLLILAVLFLSFTQLQGKELKVAFVDLDRVMREYKDFQDAQRELNSLIAEWERKRDSLKAVIDTMKRNYEIEKPMLTDEGKAEREERIMKMETQYRKYILSIWGPNGELKKKTRELVAPYSENVNRVIKEIANREEYDLILNSSSDMVIYASEKYDITDEVIMELNKEYVEVAQIPGIKLKLAIFPFIEEDEQSRRSQLGSRLETLFASAFKNSNKFELISNSAVISEMQRQNIRAEDLDVVKCKQIGLLLGAKYFILGGVKKSGEAVQFIAELYSIDTAEKIIEVEGEAPNDQSALDQEAIQKAKTIDQRFKVEQ